MAASGRVVDYLGVGLAAARPASLVLNAGVVGLYWATDTTTLSAWDGSAWTTVAAGGGSGVPSVFGRTGAVVAVSGDYTFAEIGSTPTTLAGYGITDGLTNPMTAVGDMIVGGTAGAATRVAIGTSTYVWTSNGTTAGWAASSGAGDMLASTYDPAAIAQQLLGTTATQTVTNKDLSSGTNTFPTFNQNTTGSAAKLTTARTVNGTSFDGSANIVVPNTPVTALSIVSGVVNIDCSAGELYTLTLTANVTVTFSNLPASGFGTSKMLRILQDSTGGWTFTLPASFKAIGASDTAIQSAANVYTALAITTFDQGTRWEYSMGAAAA